MEEILIAILERLSAEVPELSLIDEDTGQLEIVDEDDRYPVTFPCVLVSPEDTLWKDYGEGIQEGDVTMGVRLAIDCYDDTHIGSGTTGKIRDRMQLAGKVYAALQEFSVGRNMEGMVRVKSRNYTLPFNIKVYETIFQFHYHDELER
jgi:hypothetical protein